MNHLIYVVCIQKFKMGGHGYEESFHVKDETLENMPDVMIIGFMSDWSYHESHGRSNHILHIAKPKNGLIFLLVVNEKLFSDGYTYGYNFHNVALSVARIDADTMKVYIHPFVAYDKHKTVKCIPIEKQFHDLNIKADVDKLFTGYTVVESKDVEMNAAFIRSSMETEGIKCNPELRELVTSFTENAVRFDSAQECKNNLMDFLQKEDNALNMDEIEKLVSELKWRV